MNLDRAGFRPHLSRGFTLVEVLVALVIVGIALPALLSQMMAQLDGVGALEEKTIAYWVAENQMAQLQLRGQQTGQTLTGKDSGETDMAGLTWAWEVESERRKVFQDIDVKRLTITVGRVNEEESLVTLVLLQND